MDSEEAQWVLAAELAQYRTWTYAELKRLLDQQILREVRGPSGAWYQLEFQVFWDHRKGGPLRVLGAIDDGSWRAYCPITDSFIMRTDGSFVDE